MTQHLNPRLDGQHALITGASRGIGRAMAWALSEAGVAVALSARSREDLDSLATRIHDHGGVAHILPADLANPSEAAALPEAAAERLGGLSILINNAGLGIYGPVDSFADDDWDRVFAVNARAPFILCREALPAMRRGDVGTIINIASVVGIKAYRNQAAYTASKHALMGFSKVLAQEVQADGIRVHTICPGGVDTDMVAKARPDLDRSGLMTPEDIARAVLFLLAFRGATAVIDDLHLRRASGEPWF